MKKCFVMLILLLTCALVAVPILADNQNTTVTATVLTTEQTSGPTISPTTVITTQPPTTEQTGAENVTSAAPENATANATETATENGTATPVTTGLTAVPAATSPLQQGTGNLEVASSPMGADILIDAVYYGTTPDNITGISEGTHIVRLTLSGYYDYEGTTYVVGGQTTPVFGTLQPVRGGYSGQPAQTVVQTPVITPVTTATTSSSSAGDVLGNPTVIAAIIGTVTAAIGAGATIFTHVAKGKKE